MKKPVLVGILIFAAFMGVIVYSTHEPAGTSRGSLHELQRPTSCRTAPGSTGRSRMRTALKRLRRHRLRRHRFAGVRAHGAVKITYK